MAQQRGVRTGAEVPAETLPTVPSRTWPCNFRDFMRLRAAAQSPHRSACCLPMLSPVSLPASIWCAAAGGPPARADSWLMLHAAPARHCPLEMPTSSIVLGADPCHAGMASPTSST